jgi:hypothetical protein
VSECLRDLQLRLKAWLRVRKLHCNTSRFTVAALHRENGTTHVLMSVQCCTRTATCPMVVGVCITLCICKPECWCGSRTSATACHALVLLYTELTRASHDALWRIVPKFHQFKHLVPDALDDRCNPCCLTRFGGDDMLVTTLTVSRTRHARVSQDHAVGRISSTTHLCIVYRLSRLHL